MSVITRVLFVLAFLSASLLVSAGDEILSLPGISNVNFKQYQGAREREKGEEMGEQEGANKERKKEKGDNKIDTQDISK
jgi:hypothetical protein